MSSRHPYRGFNRLFDRFLRTGRQAFGSTNLVYEFSERDEGYSLTLDLPGFEEDGIDIRAIESSTLIITAEAGENSEARRRSIRKEFQLPRDADVSDGTATYQNGVLSIQIPASERESRGTSIDIE